MLDFTEASAFQSVLKNDDETGEMGRAIKTMCENLKGMIQKIGQASDNMLQTADSINGITKCSPGNELIHCILRVTGYECVNIVR